MITPLPAALTDEELHAPPPADDPYRYGWRYVRRVRPDGSQEYEQVPLTLDDVLHPEEDDFIVQNDQHDHIRTYLRGALKAHLEQNPRTRVFCDLRFTWDVPGLRALGPDIAVVFGIRRQRKWSTFDVAKEGVRPALVIDVTSPETRHLDLENKVIEYAQAGVRFYVIINTIATRKVEQLELIGYQLTPGGYVRFAADARGWLWLEPVELWLGVVPTPPDEIGAVALYTLDGNLYLAYMSIAQARAEAETRAEAEAQARTKAETRAREQAQRAEDLAARLAALEAELRRQRGAE